MMEPRLRALQAIAQVARDAAHARRRAAQIALDRIRAEIAALKAIGQSDACIPLAEAAWQRGRSHALAAANARLALARAEMAEAQHALVRAQGRSDVLGKVQKDTRREMLRLQRRRAEEAE